MYIYIYIYKYIYICIYICIYHMHAWFTMIMKEQVKIAGRNGARDSRRHLLFLFAHRNQSP